MLTRRFLHHHRKLILALCLAAVPLRAQFGLALSPMRMELNMAPGTQRTDTLVIANTDAATGRFRTEILDLSIDGEAVPQFEKEIASEAEFSCRNWVTVNPMEGEIAPNGQMTVRYTFRVPANAPTRTWHCALGFTSLADPRKPAAAFGIVSQLRLTCTFYITVGRPEPAGEVKRISIERIKAPETSGYRAVISVENSGLTNLRGAGQVDIVDGNGQVVQTSDFPPVVILPSRTQRLPVILTKKVGAGTYTLRARVNLGNGEIQEAALRFQLPTAE